MANLSDIPLDLVINRDLYAFKSWLRNLKISSSIKRKFVLLWSEATGVKFTAQDYYQAGIHA